MWVLFFVINHEISDDFLNEDGTEYTQRHLPRPNPRMSQLCEVPDNSDCFMWPEAEACLRMLSKLHRTNLYDRLGLYHHNLHEHAAFNQLVEAMVLLEDVSDSRMEGPYLPMVLRSLRLQLAREVLRDWGVLEGWRATSEEMAFILEMKQRFCGF